MRCLFFILGIMLSLYGYGQTERGKQALKEAELGNPKSQMSVGLYYNLGWEGFPKNKDKSLFWFKKAAKQNDSEAQMCVSEFFEYGDYFAKDIEHCIYWCKRAADNGANDAVAKIKRLGGTYEGQRVKFRIPEKEYKTLSYTIYDKSTQKTISGTDYGGTFKLHHSKIVLNLPKIGKNFVFYPSGESEKIETKGNKGVVYATNLNEEDCNFCLYNPDIPQLTTLSFWIPNSEKQYIITFDSSR